MRKISPQRTPEEREHLLISTSSPDLKLGKLSQEIPLHSPDQFFSRISGARVLRKKLLYIIAERTHHTKTTLNLMQRMSPSLDKIRVFISRHGGSTKQSILATSWLLLLRWGALVCQFLLILAVYIFFQITPPLPLLILIILFGAGTNLAFYAFFQKKKKAIPGLLFAMVMLLDVLLLTALLHATGGPMNPFTFLFLTHISLGAILMRPLWAWFLACFTIFCYAALFFLPAPISAPLDPALLNPQGADCHTQLITGQSMSGDMALHLQGMWLAFAITVFFLVHFVSRFQKDIEGHKQTLDELEM
mgnify:CR=1 FL=1